MTNSRDQLKQALSDIICASIKRDRPDAAEKVLAAMEAFFVAWPKHTTFEKLSVVIDPKQDPYYCRSFGLDVAGNLNVLIAPENEFLFAKISRLLAERYPEERDPDVAELLSALDEVYGWLSFPNEPTGEGYQRVYRAYHKARSKYD